MERIFNLFMSSSSAGGFTLYQKRNNKTPGCDSVMFDLCVGPIKGGIGSEERKQWLFANSFLDEDNDLDDANKAELKQKSKLDRILRQNKSIRFWVSSNNVFENCVFFYICSLLEKIKKQNRKYYLVQSSDGAFPFASFGELEAEDFESYSEIYKELSQVEIANYAAEWNKLCEENGEEREIRNGKLCTQFPDARDGLTTNQRLILWTMKELGLHKAGKTMRNANIVGNTMKYLHKGDFSIYKDLCNLSKKYTQNIPLIFFQGNNGTRKNPQPVVYRYTESKLSDAGEKALKNIEKLPEIFETINQLGEEIKRPSFLPGEFPHLLINGNYEIPGHDETRVYAAIKAYSENNEISDSELHSIIGNPKFADDRIIVEENFEEYHKTGKGFIKYRYPESKKIYEMILQNRVLVDGEAKIVNLKEMIQVFVEHKKRTELRIKKFELEEVQKKLKYLKGLKYFAINIDKLYSQLQDMELEDFKSYVQKLLELDRETIDIILEMKMDSLVGIEKEVKKLEGIISDLRTEI